MKVYLAGGIWGVKDPITWRKHVTNDLHEGWEAIDPTQIELFVENEHADENAQRIVDIDLAAIRDSDAMIAMISQPSWGTAMWYASHTSLPSGAVSELRPAERTASSICLTFVLSFVMFASVSNFHFRTSHHTSRL